MNIVIEAKEFGKKGALKRFENQQVKEETLQDPLIEPLDDTLEVNNKVLNINNKEQIDFQALLEFINKSFDRKFQIISDKVKAKYKSLLKQGYQKSQITNAIINCKLNKYHIENNYQYCTPEFFSRTDTIDKYGFEVKQEENKFKFAWQ
jgi:Cft2 family RNA processing exonuclease